MEWTGARYADGPTVEVETWIDSPPERVWELVTDMQLIARFSDELQEVQWLDGARGPSLGARFTGRNRNEALGEWTTTSHVVEFEPQRVFGWSQPAFGAVYTGIADGALDWAKAQIKRRGLADNPRAQAAFRKVGFVEVRRINVGGGRTDVQMEITAAAWRERMKARAAGREGEPAATEVFEWLRTLIRV